jgi:hypothetical protein
MSTQAGKDRGWLYKQLLAFSFAWLKLKAVSDTRLKNGIKMAALQGLPYQCWQVLNYCQRSYNSNSCPKCLRPDLYHPYSNWTAEDLTKEEPPVNWEREGCSWCAKVIEGPSVPMRQPLHVKDQWEEHVCEWGNCLFAHKDEVTFL